MSSLQEEIESKQVLEQAREAAYERLCLQLSEDIQQVMMEKGVTLHDIAEQLCCSNSEIRRRVRGGPMTLDQLCRILFVLGLELHLLFKPRRGVGE